MTHSVDYQELENYIEIYIVKPFYAIRTERLKELKLNDILKRKNPYLFKAKNIQTAGDFAKDILDAHLSSQEETIFGDLLEGLAIHINESIFNGYKAEQNKFRSIDLIFERDNKLYIVGIKSGPNWGNSDQINRMRDNFKTARTILKAEGRPGRIVAVNGCIYGKERHPKKVNRDPKKTYYKYCGQEFWQFISGDPQLFQKIIVPLDREVKKRDEDFKALYVISVNQLTKDLLDNFSKSGSLDWEKILNFVSKKD